MIDTPVRPDDAPGDRLLPDIARQVDQLGDQFLDLLHAGRAPDRQAIVNAYQQLAKRLEQRLVLIELMFDGQANE